MSRPLTLGPEELRRHLLCGTRAPDVPFADDVLQEAAGTHLLIFAPTILSNEVPVTLNALRERFGTDPASSEPCFYNQDWYLKEGFATRTTLDGKWHLIRTSVSDGARAKPPDEIEASLGSSETFPTAVLAAFAFFAYWLHTDGGRLWEHDFLWCSDRDHNGDRVYVGRYEDPEKVNKNGFNVHRHLSLRPWHSFASEVRSV